MPLRCLIVDDNHRFLTAASDLLEREGITVAGIAFTCAEALRQVEALEPDVTLVDIDLGEESGFDLVRRRAANPIQSTSRVILISAHDQADFADLIAASPAAGFLSKADLGARAISSLLESDHDPEPR